MGKMTEMIDVWLGINDPPTDITDHPFNFLKDKFFRFEEKRVYEPQGGYYEGVKKDRKQIEIESKYYEQREKIVAQKMVVNIDYKSYFERIKDEREIAKSEQDNLINPHKIDRKKVKSYNKNIFTGNIYFDK